MNLRLQIRLPICNYVATDLLHICDRKFEIANVVANLQLHWHLFVTLYICNPRPCGCQHAHLHHCCRRCPLPSSHPRRCPCPPTPSSPPPPHPPLPHCPLVIAPLPHHRCGRHSSNVTLPPSTPTSTPSPSSSFVYPFLSISPSLSSLLQPAHPLHSSTLHHIWILCHAGLALPALLSTTIGARLLGTRGSGM